MLAAGPAPAAHDKGYPTEADQQHGWFYNFLSRQEETISHGVIATGRWVDNLFGAEDYGGIERGSRAQIGLTTLVEEGGDMEFSQDFHGKLVLPKTRKRWRIFVERVEENITEETPEVQERSLREDLGEDERSSLAGLEYAEKVGQVEYTADAGIRVRTPPIPFVRLRARRDFPVGLWRLRLGQSVFWFKEEEPGATSEMRWDRKLPREYYFRSTSRATFRTEEDQFYYGQDFQLVHRLDTLHAFAYELRIRGESQPTVQVTNYAYGVRWRRAIHQDWLFFELRPELLHERESDFEAQPRVFFTFDAIFGDREYD
ncbi:MAG TPA: hypothetical protein VKA64_08300 [Gammaproteobacteria bacterium]|nr:hypothetical protein [Gammaproteobacteria bacterium]